MPILLERAREILRKNYDPKKRVSTYLGVLIEEFSKEELILIISHMGLTYERQLEEAQRTCRLLRDCNDRKKPKRHKPTRPGLEQGIPQELAKEDWDREHGEGSRVFKLPEDRTMEEVPDIDNDEEFRKHVDACIEAEEE